MPWFAAMALPDQFTPVRPPGPRQRWASLLVLFLGIGGFALGMVMRGQVLSATIPYSNLQAGINAAYPPGWLLEEAGRDHVFRIRDLSAAGFATTLQVALFPVNDESAARNIFDSLTLRRSRTLAAYFVVGEELFQLPNGLLTNAMRYTFVSTGENPFLSSAPVLVEGLDVLIFERDQALVITFRANADSFDRDFSHLQRFLQNLEF